MSLRSGSRPDPSDPLFWSVDKSNSPWVRLDNLSVSSTLFRLDLRSSQEIRGSPSSSPDPSSPSPFVVSLFVTLLGNSGV